KIHQWGNWYTHFEGEMDRRQIRKGSIDDAFEQADVIVQGVYRPAAIEHVPLKKLKVVGGTVGGGFGGKVDTATETMCAILAQKSGRPVKWRWTREEEF